MGKRGRISGKWACTYDHIRPAVLIVHPSGRTVAHINSDLLKFFSVANCEDGSQLKYRILHFPSVRQNSNR